MDLTTEEPEQGAEGAIDIAFQDRAAEIAIWEKAPDPEMVLVHELGHILFYPFFKPGGIINDLQEQVLNTYAKALVWLRRRSE